MLVKDLPSTAASSSLSSSSKKEKEKKWMDQDIGWLGVTWESRSHLNVLFIHFGGSKVLMLIGFSLRVCRGGVELWFMCLYWSVLRCCW